jgi:hypothetical protein
MRGIIGVAIGAFAVCAVLVAYDLGGRRAAYQQAQPYFGTDAGLIPAQFNGSNMALTNSGATAVACEPYQHAVMQERVVAGQRVMQVACVTQAGNGAAVAPAVYAQSPYLAASYPAASYTPAREVVRARPVSRQMAERVASRRTWQKSALLIGGSAGAGAGLGALMGGKKGALAGAAIGGGSAAIYDQVKRH